ncbi:MAG: SGNH/GDSL hydrolase family protein [bacterium]|jgi:hypothetical protein|nr:SGNH/GDSL hydrolase family protein [Betaproteobacteria bacterium]
MRFIYFVASCFALLALAELALRVSGLGRPILFERTRYGYRIQPSQRFRFWKLRAFYNEFGLRTGPIFPIPEVGKVRILCVGDSITNGGVTTAQHETYPYRLASILADSIPSVEVLNISAGGWALENEEGWIAAHGILGSHLVILQVATHDMHQRKASAAVLDVNPGFPSRYPVLACAYVMRRYILPRLGLRPNVLDPGVAAEIHTEADIERSIHVLDRFLSHVMGTGARLMIVHVAQPSTYEPVTELTTFAKARLRAWTQANGVRLVSMEPVMKEGGDSALFRDVMHPNEKGYLLIAQTLAPHVIDELRE